MPLEHKTIIPKETHLARINPRKGSIIISRSNTPELVGHSAYIYQDYPNLYLPDKLWQTILRKGANVDSVWLSQVLASKEMLQIISSMASGSSNSMKNISKDVFLNFKIWFPPLAEQHAIAAVLGTWDRAIEQTTDLLRALRARHRGLMQRLLTGKVRLPGFDEEWRQHSYGELLRVVKRNIKFNDGELYHLISVRRRSGGLFHRQSLYGHQILTKNLSMARSSDFLFSKMQIVHGASGLTTTEFDGMMISGSYIAVVSRNADVLEIEFFNWLSQLPNFYHQTFVSSYGVHIEKMTFDFDAYLGLATKIPATLAEQRAIARVLDTSLQEVRQQEAALTALREQKRGLMQQLLTGRVRVGA